MTTYPFPRCEGCRHWRKLWFRWGADARTCVRLLEWRLDQPAADERGAMAPCGPEGRYFEKANVLEAILSRPWAVILLGLAMFSVGISLGGTR